MELTLLDGIWRFDVLRLFKLNSPFMCRCMRLIDLPPKSGVNSISTVSMQVYNECNDKR
jgi:hypothetical protein